ncbi:LacI family transcriptional regulator [Actibacterium mucosum KCTC 23349]|uniref:LacI family transcriptional regulator n=1 Tax=Actibacterium mucosum KCTC 23349 TaxID=1454373 RepID=A0A037ZM95_9RHOB|nr:LacI family DNA-binding transcriptional regulator [Actibacterium mucosum]KAJ57229.1 LacI family transcriptional regulator [Actibacterium mucosum KCTC 23349]
MTHRFPIKEIARQAGLGTATVDRVLNNRGNVSLQTQLRVSAAIEELQAQEAQLAARGRRLFFDFVVEAPTRFSHEVKAAAEAVLPQIGTAVCRPRFLLQEIMDEGEVVEALKRVTRRGSHGVCLKLRDTARIRDAVAMMTAAKIPVITLVTDIGDTDRLAYVGLDNAGAGRTAAYLIARTLGDMKGTILATRSHERFLGEEEREKAFVKALADQNPNLQIIAVQGGSGVDFETSRLLEQSIDDVHELSAVYSMGGGNHSILRTLDHYGLSAKIFVAHDLDRDNRELLLQRRIDYVLHHDLKMDMRNLFNRFLAWHGLTNGAENTPISTVQVMTPENIPTTGGPSQRAPFRGQET